MRSLHTSWPHAHSHLSRSEQIKWLTYLLPPLAVKRAGEPRKVSLNILLTLCGWIPGVIHARRVAERASLVNLAEQQFVTALQNHVRR